MTLTLLGTVALLAWYLWRKALKDRREDDRTREMILKRIVGRPDRYDQ